MSDKYRGAHRAESWSWVTPSYLASNQVVEFIRDFDRDDWPIAPLGSVDIAAKRHRHGRTK